MLDIFVKKKITVAGKHGNFLKSIRKGPRQGYITHTKYFPSCIGDTVMWRQTKESEIECDHSSVYVATIKTFSGHTLHDLQYGRHQNEISCAREAYVNVNGHHNVNIVNR